MDHHSVSPLPTLSMRRPGGGETQTISYQCNMNVRENLRSEKMSRKAGTKSKDKGEEGYLVGYPHHHRFNVCFSVLTRVRRSP